MSKIIFVSLPDGKRYEVEGTSGQSLMEVAVANHIPGILGECGGACACGTCHVYLDETAKDLVSPPDMIEEDLLAFLDKVKSQSRLACQIQITDKMQGMIVYLP